MSESKKDINEIPIVKLTNYSFSPPGPMGWSSAEYTTMLEDPEAFLSGYKIKHPEPQLDNVMLIELPVKNRRHLEMNQSERSVVKREVVQAEKNVVKREVVQAEKNVVKREVVQAKKKSPLELAPKMIAEPKPAPMEAVQDDNFEYNYDELIGQFLDSDSDLSDMHEADVFIGFRKRKSKTYSSKRSNRVIFF